MSPKAVQKKDVDENAGPHLSISAHVVVQLGEELVTDIEQALLELAKNAYDADSPSCEITVEPDWQPPHTDPVWSLLQEDQKTRPSLVGRIRIRDHGSGISEDAVTNGWLRISASLKRSLPGTPKATTKGGRTPVGDKGLGRLATMKLGQVLRMKTAVAGETVWRTAMFSWGHFTQDRALDDVQVVIGADSEEAVDGSGTIVEVLGLHEITQWSDSTFIEKHLIPNLSSLINPFRAFDDFSISFNAGRHHYELQSLDDGVLNLASAKFSFSWHESKEVHQAFIAPNLLRGERGEESGKRFAELFSPLGRPKLVAWLQKDKKLTDRGLSFDVDAPWFCKFTDSSVGNPFPVDKKFPGGVDPGPIEGCFYYFMFHDEVKLKLISAQISTEALQAMTQIAIYRDGFRVRAHRDWLKLSEGTTSGSSFYGLRPSNVLGYFVTSNEKNPGLVEKSDREGFVDTHELRGFMVLGTRARDYANDVLEALRKSVREYQKTLSGEEEPKSRKQIERALTLNSHRAESGFESLQAEISNAKAQLQKTRKVFAEIEPDQRPALDKSVVAIDAHLESVNKSIAEIGGAIRQQTNASIALAHLSEDDDDYAERLLDAAAVGLAARSLAHELQELIRQLRSGVASVSNVNKRLKEPELANAVRLLNGTTRELGKIIATIDPMLPGSRTLKESIELAKFIDEFVDARAAVVERNGISFRLLRVGADEGFQINFSRTRFLQILENLFQNSLYWLKHGPWPDPSIRQIEITLTTNGFTWSDSGPGVKPSLESSIFDPYVSDKPKSEASGIGLHLVRTFLEVERCSIELTENRNALGRRYEFKVSMRAVEKNSLPFNFKS